MSFAQKNRQWICVLALLAVLSSCQRKQVPLKAPEPRQLEAHVRYLSETCAPRNWRHADRLDIAAVYILKQFQDADVGVSQMDFTVGGATYRNVIAEIPGRSSELIVIGAHYDAHGVAPGADDNASGVAVLLELARLLAQRPLHATVQLAAYTLEEPPFFRTEAMGSVHHARALKQQHRKVIAMLSVDMVGRSQAQPEGRGGLVLTTTPECEGLVRNLTGTLSKHGIGIKPLLAPRGTDGNDWSDHCAFWDLGVPAAMLEDWSFRDASENHTPQDTADGLDYAAMSRLVLGLHAALQAIDAQQPVGNQPCRSL